MAGNRYLVTFQFWNRAGKRIFGLGLVVFLIAGCSTLGVQNHQPPTDETPVASEPTLTPAQIETLLEQGDKRLARDDPEGAFRAYNQVMSYQDGNSRALLGIAESFLMAHNVDKAMAAFEALEQTGDLVANAYQGRGLTFLLLGNDERAQEFLDRAVQSDATFWRTWNGLGILADRTGQGEAARGYYDKALAMTSHPAELYNNMGVSFLKEKRYVEAAVYFNRALAQDKPFAVARQNLRIALAHQGKYREAVSDTTREKLPVALNNVGYIAMLHGDYAVAQAFFVQAMRASPAFYIRASRNLDRLQQIKALQQSIGTKAKITIKQEDFPVVPGRATGSKDIDTSSAKPR